MGFPVSFLAVSDFNNDAKDDLVIANPCKGYSGCSDSTLRVLLGQGDGTFKVSQYQLLLPPVAFAITPGDFNDDGKLDLVVNGSNGGSSEPFARGLVTVLIGNGKGSFQKGATYESVGTWPTSITVRDFNGDSENDVLVVNRANSGVLLGNGDGTLQPPQTYNAGGPGVVVNDFNRDNRPDAALAGTAVLLNIAPRTGAHFPAMSSVSISP